MAASKRGQEMDSDQEVSDVYDVYELPVPVRCRTAATPFCRFVPFMPSYEQLDVAARLRPALSRICCRRQPDSDCV